MSVQKVSNINEKFLYNISQLAICFQIARETVRVRLSAASVIAAGELGGHAVYHIHDAARAILSSESGPAFEAQDPAKMKPKDRLDYFRAETERLSYEEKQRQVIPVAQYRTEFARVIKILSAGLDSVPDKIEQKCSLEPEVTEQIEVVIDSIRNDMADEIKNIDE